MQLSSIVVLASVLAAAAAHPYPHPHPKEVSARAFWSSGPPPAVAKVDDVAATNTTNGTTNATDTTTQTPTARGFGFKIADFGIDINLRREQD